MNRSLGLSQEALLKLCTPVQGDRSADIVLGCVCLILALVASVGNLASLIYVKMNWNVGQKRRGNYTHQMTMILVVNIAVTDLLNGMFSASFNAANLLRDTYPVPTPMMMQLLCNFCGLIHFMTTRASILLMCCLSIFRYLAITKPTKFTNHRCKRVLYGVLISIWVVVLLMSALPYYFSTQYIYFTEVSHCWFHFWQLGSGLSDLCDYLKNQQDPKMFSFFCFYILPIHGPGLCMTVVTLLILAKLIKLHLKLKQGKGLVSKKFSWEWFKVLVRASEDSLHAKAAVSTLIILIFFVMTYGSWWIISIIHFLDMNGLVISSCPRNQFWKCKLGNLWGYVLMFSMNILIYLNAAVNPFIYYYRLFQRSQAMKKAYYTSRGTSINGTRLRPEVSRSTYSRTSAHTQPLKHIIETDTEQLQDTEPLNSSLPLKTSTELSLKHEPLKRAEEEPCKRLLVQEEEPIKVQPRYKISVDTDLLNSLSTFHQEVTDRKSGSYQELQEPLNSLKEDRGQETLREPGSPERPSGISNNHSAPSPMSYHVTTL